jgi:hypothetical protein
MVRPLRTLSLLSVATALAFSCFCASTLAQPANDAITVEKLLKSGWQVAGYAAAGGNRAAMILFKHPTESHLVQCLSGYDVTRTPREFVNCYELR